MEDFEKFIMTLIKERHYKLEVVKRDYNFLDELWKEQKVILKIPIEDQTGSNLPG